MPGLAAAMTSTSSNAWAKAISESIPCLAVSMIYNFVLPLTFFSPDKERHFHAHYTPTIHAETATALKISRFRTNRKILDAGSLADAVRGCDTYASEKVVRGPLSKA